MVRTLGAARLDGPSGSRKIVLGVGFDLVVVIKLIGKEQIKALAVRTQHHRIKIAIGIGLNRYFEGVLVDRKLLGCHDIELETTIALRQDILKRGLGGSGAALFCDPFFIGPSVVFRFSFIGDYLFSMTKK